MASRDVIRCCTVPVVSRVNLASSSGWDGLAGIILPFLPNLSENPYLSPALRIQRERGQTVVSTGPYHYVRHPMYATFIPFFIGTALLLGSWYGILFGLTLVVLIAIRAVLEERMLLKELKGYNAYMAQVKYRFIPYVW
jgi:protein-S-isoprenylcysteine O-methyltransferase Ste14